uniref:uncharacterized protein LOC124069350 n=1 Tax=Scatophagus argus TaxID=75038 RepID=UPI001ED83DAA|nr:uncharacterized protein LOC124069350 [Scatophagus argus]
MSDNKRFCYWTETRASLVLPPPPARSLPPCSPTPASLLPDSLRIFLALMMCPVKSRNGNNPRAETQSRREEPALLRFLFVICMGKAANEMTFEINLVFCVLVVLTGSSQTKGQSSALPPVLTLTAIPSHTGSSAAPYLTEGPGNGVPTWTQNPAGRRKSSALITVTKTEGMGHSKTQTSSVFKTHLLTTSSAAAATPQHTNAPAVMTAHPGTPSPSAAADGLSSTPTVQSTTPPQHLSTTEGRALLTTHPLTTVSSRAAYTAEDTRPTTSSIQPQSESLTTVITGHTLTSAIGRGLVGPTHQEVPSELNVGDEDLKGSSYHSSSPLDPLLAGLLSVFIVTTAVAFIILFLKFRQRTNHPEFHRLQDLPMDDLMEDTPLSRYTY